MFTKAILTMELEETQRKRAIANDHLELWTNQLAVCTTVEQALLALIQACDETEENDIRLEELQQQLPDGGSKPDVQIIEEILRECGPLHVADIVKHAQGLGVAFSGVKPPQQMARDKLANSKRFVLFNNNVWGLAHPDLVQHSSIEEEDDLPF